MARYFTRPRSNEWFGSDYCARPSSFEVPDHEPVDTGLVDHRGDVIMRTPLPYGFGRDEEW